MQYNSIGYVPDCYFNFDNEGFDLDPQGKITGWRALAYYPFPSVHWPTNGSMSDVLIRLPEAFRKNGGELDLTVYKINLAILEALFKQTDVPIDPVDESTYGVDLDKDGTQGTATRVVYDWAPLEGRLMNYVGDAGRMQSNKIQVTQGPSVHGWPRWSPDGTRLVYWGFEPASGTHSIGTCLADGSGKRVVVSSQEYLDRPDWHPNGRDLAYGAVTNGNWDVWFADIEADQVHLHRLTLGPEMESNPLWHPDGSAIAYKVAPTGEYNLTVQNIITFENGYASPTVHQWKSTQAIQMYDWSPDGSKIAYTAEILTNASGQDRVSYAAVVEDADYEGGEIAPGTPVVVAGRNTLGDRGPVFSPDGIQVAFWAWDKSYRATLWAANVDGTNLRQVTAQGFDMYPRWRPDGQALLFESSRNGNMDIWIVTLDD